MKKLNEDEDYSSDFGILEDRSVAEAVKMGYTSCVCYFELNDIAEKHTELHPEVDIQPFFFDLSEFEFFKYQVYNGRVIVGRDRIGRPIYKRDLAFTKHLTFVSKEARTEALGLNQNNQYVSEKKRTSS